MLLGLQPNANQQYATPADAVVVFDPIRRLVIELAAGEDNELDVVKVYSDWKVWFGTGPNLKYAQAFRYVGADPISDIQSLGSTFFLMNGWRFRPAELDHRVTLTGNLFVEGGEGRVDVPTLGGYTVTVAMFVSNLVDAAVARLDLAQLQEAVFIDVDHGVAGTTEGIGTPTNPVNNIADAFTIANEENLRAFSIIGLVTLDRDVDDYRFLGTVGPDSGTLDFGGYSVGHSTIENLLLTGDAGGAHISAYKCALSDLVNCAGNFSQCALNSLFLPGDESTTTLTHCYSNVPGSGTPIIDLGDQTADNLQVRSYSGGLTLTNIDVPTQKVSVDMSSGHLILDSTCEAGEVVVRGVGKLTDNSIGTLTVDKLGFVGMPGDDPHEMRWMYELIRRAMLSAYSAGL